MSNPLVAMLRSTRCCLFIFAVFGLISPSAFADDKKLCVPPGDGVPGRSGPPEWLSGSTANMALDDPRWRGAASQNYGSSGSPHTRMRVVHSNNRLYLSFQIFVDPSASTTQDSVYIALAQNEAATHHLLRLRLSATSNTTASPTGVALEHTTWSGTAWAGAAPPTWVEDKAAWLTIDATDDSAVWAINLKIDYNSLGFTAPFKIWAGTAVQLTTTPVTYSPYVWPLGTQGPWASGPAGGLNQDIPSADWGDVSIGTSGCTTGISLTMNTIGVKSGSTLGSNISTITNNTFAAWPTYNGVSTGAGKVNARFRIANWGSSSEWIDLGPDFASVPSAAGGTIERTCIQGGTPACPTLAAGQTAHQCILVELSSPQNVTFLNESVYRNMDFVNASYFERDAEISLKGVKPLPGSPGKRDVYLYTRKQNMPQKARGPLDSKALMAALKAADDYSRHVYRVDPKAPSTNQPREQLSPITSSMTPDELIKSVWPNYEVHVYYDAGQDVQVGGVAGRRLMAAPSFGFYAYHQGNLSGWLEQIVGLNATLVKVAPNFYKVQVPDNGSVKVVTRLEAVEPGRTPTLSQIGRGDDIKPCPKCPPVPPTPKPGTCNCTLLGGPIGTDLGWVALFGLSAAVLRRRRGSR